MQKLLGDGTFAGKVGHLLSSMSRKAFLIAALLGTSSTLAVAQSLPATTNAIPDQEGNPNGAAVSVVLTNHFTIPGLSGDIMRFVTRFGSLDVEMLPAAAPNHVINFQGYAERGDYDNTIIHRIADFSNPADGIDVVQGGGFTAEVPTERIPTEDDIALEYNEPNARGTLAAARGTDADSANSQWYFNTSDNSTVLGPDNNPPGFTVFGRVIGNGMEVIDAIAEVPSYPFSVPFNEIPLVDFEFNRDVAVEDYVWISSIREVPLYPTTGYDSSALVFSVSSSDENVVVAEIVSSTLVLSPRMRGSATITVTATDVRGGTAMQEFNFSTSGIEITVQPASIDVAAGTDSSLSVTAAADSAISYQWYRQRPGETSPTAITGATAATLNLSDVTASDMGFYWVNLTTVDSELNSDVAIVTLSGGTSRLANLSTRGSVPAGETLTPGFVLRGDGAKDLVIRAVGPTLVDFGVTSAMADPVMDLTPLGATTSILTNDNWEDSPNSATLASISAELGAFPLGTGSLDAAVLTSVALPNTQGNTGYTVQIRSSDGSSGIALAEIYDPDGPASNAQLSNISARGFSGNGDEVLAPGFVIDGTGAKTMLIRVVGPTLTNFGVTGTMTDPRFEVIPVDHLNPVAANDNWGGTAALKAAFATAGAFAFPDDNSLDAAVVVRLPPGAYTVRPVGANEGTGVILVEAYEVIE